MNIHCFKFENWHVKTTGSFGVKLEGDAYYSDGPYIIVNGEVVYNLDVAIYILDCTSFSLRGSISYLESDGDRPIAFLTIHISSDMYFATFQNMLEQSYISFELDLDELAGKLNGEEVGVSKISIVQYNSVGKDRYFIDDFIGRFAVEPASGSIGLIARELFTGLQSYNWDGFAGRLNDVGSFIELIKDARVPYREYSDLYCLSASEVRAKIHKSQSNIRGFDIGSIYDLVFPLPPLGSIVHDNDFFDLSRPNIEKLDFLANKYCSQEMNWAQSQKLEGQMVATYLRGAILAIHDMHPDLLAMYENKQRIWVSRKTVSGCAKSVFDKIFKGVRYSCGSGKKVKIILFRLVVAYNYVVSKSFSASFVRDFLYKTDELVYFCPFVFNILDKQILRDSQVSTRIIK